VGLRFALVEADWEASMKKFVSIQILLLTMFCGTAAIASAQGTGMRAASVSKSATITAINPSTRNVTLKDAQGHVEDFHCGPEIARFNELKVGDTVTFSYHAAIVYQIAKPGAAATGADVAITRGQGPRPSGAVTQQQKATVTVETVDPAASTVSVRTAEGHLMTAQVQDKKQLDGVKAGDKIEVTFTEALMMTVESGKK
jgi:Cu/Ag efflux protein CusF